MSKTIDTRRRAYTIPEVSDLSGVSKGGLYRAIRDGEIRAVKFAGRLVVPAAELDRLLGGEQQ